MKEAQVDWLGHTPRSNRFDDIYYNPEDPLGESRHVFIEGACLAAQIEQHPCLHVGETGFGTGLNFLLSWQQWRQQARSRRFLRYYSIEAYPLSRMDLRRSLQPFDELKEFSEKLLQQYPNPDGGFHLLSWPEERLELVLIFLPVEQALAELAANMHCWYLDGFAPAKNPEMWQEPVLRAIARHALPGCTLATFTAAGFVRRALQAQGFDMRKCPGFGRKREMLTGLRRADPGTRPLPAWLQQAPQAAQKAIVVGAGIAGAQVAWHLQQAGCQVTVLEGEDQVATQGSGNPRGLISPAIHADASRASRFFQQAYTYAWRQIHWLRQQGHAIEADLCGVWRLLNEAEIPRFQQALENHGYSPESLQLGPVELPDGQKQTALKIHNTGWINPADWVHALLAECTVVTGFRVEDIQQDGPVWQVRAVSGETHRAPLLVLCQSLHSLQWASTTWLPLRARPGHLLYWPARPESRKLATALTGQHYLLPPRNDQLLAGSSFEHLPREDWLKPLPVQHRALEQLAEQLLTDWPWLGKTEKPLQGRRGMRAVSPDHLPLAGPVADYPGWQQWLAPHAQGTPLSRLRGLPPNLPGLFVLSGLGARGLAAAPLAARLLCDWIYTPQQLSVPLSVAEALHPARYLLRQARKT